MATTTTTGLPIPVTGDTPNVPGDLATLGAALDKVTVPLFASTGARDTAYAAAPFKLCVVGASVDAGTLYVRRSGVWWAIDANAISPAWTPTIGGSSGNPSTSAVAGSYVAFGGMVDGTASFTRSATAGGGYYTIAAPLTIDAAWAGTNREIGRFFAVDGASLYEGFIEAASTTSLRFRVQTAVGAYNYIGPGYVNINSGASLFATFRYKSA